jgi:hypothetical protein
MPWYIAESRDRVIRFPNRVSNGVECEGYETPVAGQVYMHVVELSPEDVARLRHRVEDGKTREQLAFYGEERWYLSKNGKCRWPGTSLHSRAKKDLSGKWQPVPIDDATARRLIGAPAGGDVGPR